jgi:hypothetical protein
MIEPQQPPQMPNLPPPAHDKNSRPVDFRSKLLTLLPPVLFDSAPARRKFGQVLNDVQDHYEVGDVVQATFYAGHPRNVAQDPNMQLEKTFMTVEKYEGPSVNRIVDAMKKALQQRQISGTVSVDFQPSSSGQTIRVVVSKARRTRFIFQATNGMPDDQEYDNASRTLPIANLIISVHDGDIRVVEAVQHHQSLSSDNLWRIVRDDNDWDTRFHWWKPVPGLSSESRARLEWTIGGLPTQGDGIIGTAAEERFMASSETSVSGLYRLHYYGADKAPRGRIRQHEGVSSVFAVGDDVQRWPRSLTFEL